MQMNNLKSKAGVSLITVLLFMLVATIAATATWKWISSEGKSSASRMLKREAYQSSVAGIEATRAFMTYKGNDAGAILTQYLRNGKKPILLNSVVQSSNMQNNGISKKQNFKVWLTGVEVPQKTGDPYKVQLLSVGESRNGTTHSEEAILSVTGLYQVTLPKEQTKVNSLPFNESYFGGSYHSAGVKITSAIVNGDWDGNPQEIEKTFVATGNIKLSGNNVQFGQLTCIGGTASIENNGMNGQDVYVDENFNGGLTLSGSVYFGGDVTIDSSAPEINTVGKNMTLLGSYSAYKTKNFLIKGNLVVDGKGQIQYYSNNDRTFKVNGDVWMPGSDLTIPKQMPLWNNQGTELSVILGDNEKSRIYIKNGRPYADYVAMRNDRMAKQRELQFPKSCTGNNQQCSNPKAWNSPDYTPYPEDNKHTANWGYMYYMPAGNKDVEFGDWTDGFWDKCVFTNGAETTKPSWYNWWNFIVGHDASWNCNGQGKAQIASWFVDLTNGKKDATTKFRGSYSTDGPGDYRYLNASGQNGNPLGSPYCNDKKGNGTNNPNDPDGAFQPVCGVKPWFKVNGTFQKFPSEIPSDFATADAVKEQCDTYWVKEPCGTAKYKVNNPLVTAHDKFMEYAGKGCKNVTWDKDLPQKLTSCYNENFSDETKRTENLYNDYLVVRVSGGGEDKCPLGTFSGKFIIVADEKISCQSGLPTVPNGSYVMLYLKQGASNIGGNNINNNYFIYSKGSIDNSNNLKLNGSIYIPTEDACNGAGIGKIQGGAELKFNQDLVNDLTEHGVICANDGSVCGGTAPKSSSSNEEDAPSSETPNKDVFHIAVAPQLQITLESQYESKKKSSKGAYEIPEGSEILLPRILYLTRDAIGELKDYYNLIPLNGSKAKKEPSQMSCPSGIPATGRLSDAPDRLLPEGIHTCKYGSGSDAVPLYLVVKGLSSEAPTIEFTEAGQELTKGGTADVFVKVPASTRSKPISVDVFVPSLPTGWNLAPQDATFRNYADGGAVYTLTIQPSATENRFRVFSVTTNNDAVSSTLNFEMRTPCDGCTIGSTSTHFVYMTGSVDIDRREIGEYCTIFADDCDEELKKAAERPNCNIADGKAWVGANGLGCTTTNVNNSWKCSTNNTIGLKGENVPSYCEILIPYNHNTVQAPVAGATYKLYASLKKKPYTLTIKYEGENKYGNANVVMTSNSQTQTPTLSETPVTYEVFAGETVHLSFDKTQLHETRYISWSCSGANCPQGEISGLSYDIPAISSDNVLTLHIKSKSDDCFYEDFSKLKSFCDNEDGCIAHCEGATKNTACENTTSFADWKLMYGNNNEHADHIAPIISGGYIAADCPKNNCNAKSGGQTLILNTRKSGYDGTMTAMMTVGATNKKNEYLNSGLVLRSDKTARSYLILNVFNFYTKKPGSELTARLCRADSLGLTNENGCLTKVLGTNVYVPNGKIIKEKVTLKGSNVQVTTSVDGNDYSTEFNLTDTKYNLDADHLYVGFILSDEPIKIYDISWEKDGVENCLDMPNIYCNFGANYLGGLVPIDSNVTPWKALSSWFKENHCTVKYFYTGTDNGTGGGPNSNALSDSIYNFSEEGLHGTPINNPQKDAKIQVDCGSIATSLNGKEVSCGEFWVGEAKSCSENITIFDGNNYVSGTTASHFPIDGIDGKNLRDAMLKMVIRNMNGYAKVYLEDRRRVKSYSRTIQGSGDTEIKLFVNDFVSDGFDPQAVTSVVIESIDNINFTVNQVFTSCPNALAINDCSARLEGYTWKIQANFTNLAGAATNGCSIKASDNFIKTGDKMDCPSNGQFSFTDETVYNRINNGSLLQPVTFTISATSQAGETVSCTATADEIKTVDLTCPTPRPTIAEGKGSPAMTMYLNNCPPNGCSYTVSLQDESISKPAICKGSPCSIEVPANVNNKLSTGVKSYQVQYDFGDYSGKGSCEFEVTEATDAKINSCNVIDGMVNYDIKFAQNQSVASVKLNVHDKLGISLATKDFKTSNTNDSYNLMWLGYNWIEAQTYIISLQFSDGSSTISCGEYTAPRRDPPSITNCSKIKPMNQTPGQNVCFNVTATNCNNNCSYKIDGNQIGTGYGGNHDWVCFQPGNVTQSSMDYILVATAPDGQTALCNFKVEYAVQNSSSSSDDFVPSACYVGGADYNNWNNIKPSNFDGKTTVVQLEGKCYKCRYENNCDQQWMWSGNNYDPNNGEYIPNGNTNYEQVNCPQDIPCKQWTEAGNQNSSSSQGGGTGGEIIGGGNMDPEQMHVFEAGTYSFYTNAEYNTVFRCYIKPGEERIVGKLTDSNGKSQNIQAYNNSTETYNGISPKNTYSLTVYESIKCKYGK